MPKNAVLAPTVIIPHLLLFREGRSIIQQVETIVTEKSYLAESLVLDVPAIKYLNFSPKLSSANYVPTLGCMFVDLPVPDLFPELDADEAFVFRVGRPIPPGTHCDSTEDKEKLLREIAELYDAVRQTV